MTFPHDLYSLTWDFVNLEYYSFNYVDTLAPSGTRFPEELVTQYGGLGNRY